jgi:hypothetical protein
MAECHASRPVSDIDLALQRRIDQPPLDCLHAVVWIFRKPFRREGAEVGRQHVATLMQAPPLGLRPGSRKMHQSSRAAGRNRDAAQGTQAVCALREVFQPAPPASYFHPMRGRGDMLRFAECAGSRAAHLDLQAAGHAPKKSLEAVPASVLASRQRSVPSTNGTWKHFSCMMGP